MKKSRFFIHMNGLDGETMSAMDGYQARVTPDKYKESIVLTFHRERGRWSCSEASTGMLIKRGDTRKEALENTLEVLRQVGEKVFKEKVNRYKVKTEQT